MPPADAAPVDAEKAAALAVVERDLVRPLVQKDEKRSRFSRAAPMPTERRARVTDEAPVLDARGKTFRAFAIDQRSRFRADDSDDGWTRAAMVGCVYDDAVYVKLGTSYRPAATLLGKKAKEAPTGVCQAAPTTVAANG